jgi:hypothetical protein
MNDHNGIYNLAAAPSLPLLKLLALAQTPPLPVFHLFAAQSARWGRMFSKKVDGAAPLPWDYMRYSWTVSTDRMKNELEFEPLIDAESTVREFGDTLRAYRYETNRPYRFGYDRWRDAQKGAELVVSTTQRTRTVVSDLRGARAE